MYDPAIVLRDSIIHLDSQRHPRDTMEIFKPLFTNLMTKDPETLELKREEMEYEARMEVKEFNDESND